MANVLLVSPTTHKFKVKAGKFSNENEELFEMQANVASEVPKDIAEIRMATYPKQYKVVNKAEADRLAEEEDKRLAVELNLSVFEEEKAEAFDVKEWFKEGEVTEARLKKLADINKLWAIAKVLRVNNVAQNIGEEKLIGRIMAKIDALKEKKVVKENDEPSE